MREYKFCPLCGHLLHNAVIDDRIRQFCPVCQIIHYKNPKPTVAAIAELDGSIVLIKRAVEPKKGLWTLPSGFMEIGESPQEACLRELKEETGLNGNIVGLVDVYHEYNDMYGDLINITYYVELQSGIPAAGDDADDAALIPFYEIKDLGFDSLNHAWEEYLKKFHQQ